MPRHNRRKRANIANLSARWSISNKRFCPGPDSEVLDSEIPDSEVPDILNQVNTPPSDSVSVCLKCVEHDQKTFVSTETQTLESYKNSTHIDWLVFYLFILLLGLRNRKLNMH